MATLNINLDNVQPLNTLLTGISQLGYSGNAGLFLKINATEDGFEFSAAGSSGVSIGDTIGGGTAGRVLFEGASNVLADSAGLKYSDTLGLEVEGTGTFGGGWRVGLNLKGTDITNRISDGIYGYGEFLSGGSMFLGYTSNKWGSITFVGRRAGRFWAFGDNFTPSSIIHAKALAATDTVIIAQGTTAQTGNLFEARNVGGSVLASVNQAGQITSPAFIGRGRFDYINTPNNVYSCLQFLDANGNTVVYQNLLFGGTTSSFPAIKRNGTQIDIRLADDSGYADLAIGNLVSNTVSGIQLATAASQKIGFWGATPIVQPTTAITAATYASVSGSFVKASDTFDGYSIGQVVKALRNEGLLA